jgi:hypothetical protein
MHKKLLGIISVDVDEIDQIAIICSEIIRYVRKMAVRQYLSYF